MDVWIAFFTHSPLAYFLNDFVMADGLAEHNSPSRNAVGLNVTPGGWGRQSENFASVSNLLWTRA